MDPYRSILLVLALCLPLGVHSQVISLPEAPDTSEWRAWTGLRLAWKPIKSIRLSFEEQWRLQDDFGALDRMVHQFGLAFHPQGPDWLEAQALAVGYRHSSVVDNSGANQGIERFGRWNVDYCAGGEWKRWSLDMRLRHQRQRALWLKDGDDPTEVPEKELSRVKVELGYNIRKWKADPTLALERFHRPVPEGWPPDAQWRVRLGTSLKTGKRQQLKLFIQRDWKQRYLPSGVGATLDDFRLWGSEAWTIGATYGYGFKRRKRKD